MIRWEIQLHNFTGVRRILANRGQRRGKNCLNENRNSFPNWWKNFEDKLPGEF